MGLTEAGGQSREDRSRELLREIWLRNRPLTIDRLAVVQSALDALAAGGLEDDQRSTAVGEAHKLRGILGTYGFAEGSELAGEAEDLLSGEGAGAGDIATRLRSFSRALPGS